jgi:hypothetical protein
MTVERMRREMSNDEFVMWTRYWAVVRQTEELAAKRAR